MKFQTKVSGDEVIYSALDGTELFSLRGGVYRLLRDFPFHNEKFPYEGYVTGSERFLHPPFDTAAASTANQLIDAL